MMRQKARMSNQKGKDNFSLFAVSLELAFFITVPLVACALLGLWLDSLFGTRPFMLIGGVVAGIAISTAITVRRVLFMIRQADKEYEERKKSF